jgi:hypothetical protein
LNLSRIQQINWKNNNKGRKTFTRHKDNNSEGHLASVIRHSCLRLNCQSSNSFNFNLEARTLRRSSDKLVNASNNSSSQINGKQKRVSLHHTFIYIVSQVTPKIFFRFTIRGGGLTNRPKAQPFLFLLVHILFPIISCQHSRIERMSGWI